MKLHPSLALSVLLVVAGGCSDSPPLSPDGGEGDEMDGGAGSSGNGGSGGGATGIGESGVTGNDGPTRLLPGATGGGWGGGTTGAFRPDGGRWEGGATGGWGGTTGSFRPDGGSVSCDPNGVCCDETGFCCLEDFGICFGDGGSPFGEPDPPETVDGGWTLPPDATVDVEPPSEDKPAWRDSTEPLCTEEQGYVSTHALWSDERGVFVLVSAESYYYGGFPFFPGSMEGDCPGCPSVTLWHNDGTGWAPYFEADQQQYFYAEHQLAGIPNGPLFAYGYGDSFEGEGCGLAVIDDSSYTCQPLWEATAVSVVDENLAYAVGDGTLIRYRNGRWGPHPGVLNSAADLTALWANETSLFAGGRDPGQWLQLVDDQWVVLDTGTLERFQTLWGYSETDVYAGTQEGGLYHYDGTSVTEIDWPYESCQYAYPRGIRGMWGADGVTYFHTSTQLAKLENGSVEIIAEWPCEYSDDGYDPPTITSIWGNAADELFISVTDMREPRQTCGVTFVMFYDGEDLHRL